MPFHEVDAHNIVPVWEASDKRETGARTIRNKINRQLGEYLEVSLTRNASLIGVCGTQELATKLQTCIRNKINGSWACTSR